MKFILVFFISLITAASFAQVKSKQDKIDSLKLKLATDSSYIYRYKLAKPYLRVENRYSFISKKPVNLVGFMAGATFIERHIICAGYYVLNRYAKKSIELIDENNITRREYLSLNYFVFSYQYVLCNRHFLQINAPFEIGYGLYSTRTTDNLDAFLGKSNGNIIPISAGVQFILKPIKWLGISCVGGYRHAIQEKNINLNFTGFYYSFGLWLDARHVLRLPNTTLRRKNTGRKLKSFNFDNLTIPNQIYCQPLELIIKVIKTLGKTINIFCRISKRTSKYTNRSLLQNSYICF